NALVDNPQDAIGTRNVIPAVPQNVVLAWQKIFTATLINEAKFGLNRSDYHNWTYGSSPISASFAGFDGVSDNTLDTEVGTSFSYIDNLTKIIGRHTLKAGIDIRRIRLNNSGNTIQDQSIDFATNEDFINNHADQVTYLAPEGVRGGRRTFYMGYVQDEFKVSPRLTLNLGLRYEFYNVYHEVKGRSAVVDILGCGGFCPKGTPFYDPNPYDFGPRVGVAWSPKLFGGKTTVLRSGFGMYYGANQNDDFSDPMESSVPRYTITDTDAPNLSYPIDPFLAPQYQFFSPKAINRHRKDGYYENWDFNIQQELPFNFTGQVGYVGSEGHHLFSREQVNLRDPVTGLRPLPEFAQFGLKSNYGNNNFNALQVSVQRRFTNGWLWQTQYMWSHAIADSSGGAGETFAYQNQACRACDRSNSGFDVRHTMITNSVYQLPFGNGKRHLNNRGLASQVFGGWELSGVMTIRTGLPVNITMKPNKTPLDGNTSGQRPDLVPGQSIYAAHQTIDNWFNPDAFAFPAPGTYGNLGRNVARGPGYYEVDTALQKQFALTERIKLNFRAEGFNLFNHPAYANPKSVWTSTGSFGQIQGILNDGAVGTGTPRRMQFVMRLEF
ncbi:MAG TPA: TonB-dependent receptor, partial [Terriglobia bacterium]|nr:TonB-dependent receptor [Terriglobia bacterium]